jgi:hypothetical protein
MHTPLENSSNLLKHIMHSTLHTPHHITYPHFGKEQVEGNLSETNQISEVTYLKSVLEDQRKYNT